MFENIVFFLMGVGVIEIAADLAQLGWTAAKPVVTEAYNYGSDAVELVIPKATH